MIIPWRETNKILEIFYIISSNFFIFWDFRRIFGFFFFFQVEFLFNEIDFFLNFLPFHRFTGRMSEEIDWSLLAKICAAVPKKLVQCDLEITATGAFAVGSQGVAPKRPATIAAMEAERARRVQTNGLKPLVSPLAVVDSAEIKFKFRYSAT